MKKLTAGIFTVLMGLVSVNAADAAVASKDYVDAKAAAVVNDYKTTNDQRVQAVEGEVDTLQNQVANETTGLIKKVGDLETQIGNVAGGELTIKPGAVGTNQLADDAVTNAKLADDAVQTENIVDGTIVNEDLAAGVAVANIGYTPENAANKTQTLNADSTEAQYPSAKAVYDTINALTNDATADLITDVASLQSDVSVLQTGKVDQSVYNTKVAALEKADTDNLAAAAADAASKANAAQEAAESYADGLKTTIDAAYVAADAETLQSAKNYADAEDAKIEGVIGEVAEGKTVVGLIAEAKDAAIAGATYDDTAVKADIKANADAIDAIEASDYATSGISAALVQKYNAYEQTIADNATAATNAASAAETAAKSYTDTTIANLKLNELSRVPAECGVEGKYCALTSDGTNYLWEVIERATGEVQPAGTPIPSVTQ